MPRAERRRGGEVTPGPSAPSPGPGRRTRPGLGTARRMPAGTGNSFLHRGRAGAEQPRHLGDEQRLPLGYGAGRRRARRAPRRAAWSRMSSARPPRVSGALSDSSAAITSSPPARAPPRWCGRWRSSRTRDSLARPAGRTAAPRDAGGAGSVQNHGQRRGPRRLIQDGIRPRSIRAWPRDSIRRVAGGAESGKDLADHAAQGGAHGQRLRPSCRS